VVAIKELSESSNPGSDTELLEEARIMASVMHPCCIRIMAVCVTRQMMLVTPLMPFGSLLDYLHRNRSNIGSRSMLTWAKQIAEASEMFNRKAASFNRPLMDYSSNTFQSILGYSLIDKGFEHSSALGMCEVVQSQLRESANMRAK